MGHRKWEANTTQEHNALYDAWEVERDRANDLLNDRNAIQEELDEARKRIAELESPLRVPFSDAQIEGMAKAARRAWAGCEGWESMSNAVHQQWRNTIRAALAAGGLEPCPVPEYDPADEALSTPIIADLHKQLEAARREVDEVRRHISVTMSREHQARKEAQEAKRQADEYLRMYKNEEKNAEHWKAKFEAVTAERDDLRDEVDDDNTNAAAVNDLLVQVQNLTAERDALRERDAVPVKVRWTVTAEDAAKMMQHIKAGICDAYSAWDDLGENYKEDFIKTFEKLLPRLAAHAVIDVPAGVPSDPELVEIMTANKSSDFNTFAEWDVARVTAILAALTPYLRDPVGWELDVTADTAEIAWLESVEGSGTMRQIIARYNDWLRSRIRPTFECKECANWKAHAAAIEDSSFDMIKRINLARAALEGE